MSWNNLRKNIDYLDFETFNKVYENLVIIKDKLTEYEVQSEALIFVTATRDVPITEVRGKLQIIEDDITILNQAVQSLYYRAHQAITTYFGVDDYNRWVDILNDLYGIVIENKGVWSAMQLTKETDNPIAADKFGKIMYIRGDKLG